MSGTIAGLVVLAFLAGATALRARRKLARIEQLIRDARAIALTEITFQPVDARWMPHLDGLDVPAGFIALGDFVEVPAGRPASGALRGFVDAEGTTYGWVAKAGTGRIPVMALASATETDIYLTRLTPATGGHLAAPPFAHRSEIHTLRGAEAAITAHRERIADVAGLQHVATLAELQAELQRVRGLTRAWRQAQPPAALLEADLRSILGARYEALGPRLARKLTVEMPTARVVS